MTETKMISEREAVRREREAYARGFADSRPILTQNENAARDLANAKFPLPKIVRPRRITLKGRGRCTTFDYRIRKGELEWANVGKEDWSVFGDITVSDQTQEFMVAIGQLFAQPLEEVEDSSDV